MGNHRKLQFAIRAALAAASATAVVPIALAQTAPAVETATDTTLQEVVVTGSRIQSPNLNAVSPITSVSAVEITQTGLTRVEDILNNLPMVMAGQNSAVSNGADGTATVDLRGLGPQRTLVLVNGRRLGPGNGAGGASNISDINQIPAALIDHIDILTGGSSATYGADAVAGVVNFVLNTHYEGIKVDASYDFYNNSNNNGVVAGVVSAAGDQLPDSSVNTGFSKHVSVIMGSNFAEDKGNATAYFTYDTQAPVLESKYDYSSCALGATAAGGLVCGGSGTSAKNGAGGYFLAYGAGPGPAFVNTVDGLTGQFRPFTGTDLYNFGPLNFAQVPNERWTGGTFLTYDINPGLTAYSELMFTRNSSTAQIAASGSFFQTGFIPCADPLLTAQEKAAICGVAAAQGGTQPVTGLGNVSGADVYIARRNAEGGGRVATFQSDAFREVLGLRGDIVSGWTFDVYAQHSSVDNSNANLNYFSNANILNALTVVTSPTTGAPVCASVLNGTDTRCVPWNIWVPHGVTPAAEAYLAIPLLVDATTTEYVVSGDVVGDLGHYGVKIPMADEGMKVSVGAEWRSESANFNPDYESQLGNAGGSGGPTVPIAGEFTVKEVFAEFTLPIADHMFMADSLSLLGGYRYSDYSEGFKTNTYKIGMEWAPIRDVKLRGSFQRAVRAPNIAELFSPTAVVLDGSTDPCAGAIFNPAAPLASQTIGSASGATRAQCAAMGVSAAQYGAVAVSPAGQYNGFTGGNPGLTPETALTYSVGLVIQPTFLPTFNFTIDYFDIKVENTIGPIGADTILSNCLVAGTAASPFCAAVHRDAGGTLWRTPAGFVDDLNVNIGSLSTKGVDFKANYTLDMASFGKLTFMDEGTKLIQLDTQPLTGGPSFNCAGFFGVTCGNPAPDWRNVFSTTWATPWDALDVTARWRYFGTVSSEQTSSDPQLAGNALPQTAHIDAFSYFDLTAQFKVYKTLSLQLGVNNILDKAPPIETTGGHGFGSDCPTVQCNGNTYGGVYDPLGRFFFAHATVQF
jgi:iron complex outermembrane recepter protein